MAVLRGDPQRRLTTVVRLVGVHIISYKQCSEPSSPSVLGVGPDGPLVVVRLFFEPKDGLWDMKLGPDALGAQ